MISADIVLMMAGTGLLVGIISWGWHLRVRSRITAQADRRIHQMSELIDRAQCALWEADVTLETNDWAWRLRLHPSEFSRHLFGETLDGNHEDIWRHFQIDTHGQMGRRAREAIERGHPGYQQEFRAVRDGRTYWLHENVSINRTGPDNFRLVGLIADLTAQREAETARRQSELALASILAQAQCMIWRATVEDKGGELHWPHFDVPRSRLSELLFGAQRSFAPERCFWDELETPDQKDMDERSTRAIRDNASGYEQKYRVITKAGRTFHLHELVSITRLGTGSWSLVGVVTDITAQTEAEEAQQRTQTTLEHLLERADCLLWQATVKLSPKEVEWDISCYKTAFTRRIFGEVPPPTKVGLWYRFDVPERPEMDRRACEALENKRPGYEQQFRLIKEGRTLWVDERVSITPTGPNRFWLVGLATDITVRREAEEAFRESQERLRGLLDGAECMVWDATVEKRPDDTLAWDQYIPPSALYRRIFGDSGDTKLRLRWDELRIPEYPDMVERTRLALETGAPGYTQEFHIVQPGGDIWLRETVTIKPAGTDRFQMAGVITDITAQRRAEEARQKSELRLGALLDRADCMVWQGQCWRQGADDFRWEVFTPSSQLYRRIFGYDPKGERHFDWTPEQVPEFWEMRDRARQALLEGRTAYEQVFHCLHPDGEIWLQESVSIKPLGPDHWELTGIITNISALRNLERARQTSEQRLGELLSRADCLLWESTVELLPGGWKWGRNIQPSLLYQRITGVPLPAPTEAMWPLNRVPERPEMDRRCREALLSGRNSYEQVFHYLRADGSSVWLSENVTIQKQAEGRYWLIGVAVDITAQRVSEEARLASEQRLLEILTRAECLLWEATADLNGDIWQWHFNIQPSQLGRRLHGREQPPAEAGLWRKFHIPERGEMDARCRTAMESGLPGYEQVFHIVQPDGSKLWIRESVSIRPLGGKRFSLVGVAVDITATRSAEEALATEKERLAVTLRAMNEAVITTDTTGCVQFMNPAAAALLECPAEAGVGRPVPQVCQLEHSRTGAPYELPVVRVSRGDIVANLPAQTQVVGRAGRRRVVEGCCAPIHAADSTVTGTVIVLRDVTEQDRLEQELVRATRLESVGVLAGGIAHDFNNILTAVMGNLALAQLDIPPENPALTSLRSAEKAALRARDLTQQLLTFARGGDPVRAAIQLDTVVREMAGFALHGSPIKAHYDLAPDLWPADADKGQIGRVVQNLVINAVQAMPNGGSLQIIARNDPQAHLAHPSLGEGDFIQIAITDSGEGITPENLSRIFDPYFTTKQTGTGLGLAAVYSIIRKHHGHIEVDSQPGQGTTFRFWLPALNNALAKRDTQNPWGSSILAPRYSGKVLFMDDEQIIRDMAATLLGRFGLTVDCAADGAEAVQKYREAMQAGQRHALVIMDLTVPGGMGGLAALGKLREIDPAVKAVVSSGYSSDPVLANFRQHGFQAVMAKPYEVNEVARILRELMPAG